jgi:Rieske Fe-S protein
MCDESCSRRRFLACAAALAAGGALSSLTGCGAPSARPLLDHASAKQVELLLTEHPDLQEVGGAMIAQAGDGGERIVVVRRSLTEVVAVSPICPHQKCIVNYTGDVTGSCFVCPCHGSTFGPDGELRHGPATQGLIRYPAVLESDRVLVTL